MFWRIISTAASLVVALAGAAVIDCVNAVFRIMRGDAIAVCETVGAIGPDRGLWVGVGLMVAGAIALVATWLPSTGAGVQRRRLEPADSLKHNLDRITHSSLEQTDPSTVLQTNAMRLTGRVEALETALEADTVPTREVTRQWMGLLRDANDLHNSGEVATEDFKRINTRLLDLFAAPTDRSDAEMAGSPRH